MGLSDYHRVESLTYTAKLPPTTIRIISSPGDLTRRGNIHMHTIVSSVYIFWPFKQTTSENYHFQEREDFHAVNFLSFYCFNYIAVRATKETIIPRRAI